MEEEEEEDWGSFAVDDDEEWDIPKIEGKVRWENSEFRKYVRSQKADDDIQTLLTEVQCH